ncbi:MAG: hypothetical protein NWR72_04830, partial [Bacteroidia bacterium]|nr:hypothetical protein [Bacteroidia bacterium]
MIQFRFMRLRMAFCFLGLMAAIPGYAAVVTSTGSGAWSNPVTWGGAVPTAADDVIIGEGHTINASGILEFATLLIEDATISGDPVG